jgi:rhomboid protease GluP
MTTRPQHAPPHRERRSTPVLTDLLRSAPSHVPVTVTLLVINVLVFLAMVYNGAGLWHTSTVVPLAWGANFGPATQDGQWWRLCSALFLHFGIVHLTLNMWALWDIGRLLEQLYGRWRYLALYLGSGVIGNLVSLALQGNQAVSGGASGAIFSLYGALLVFLLRERRQVDSGEFKWLFGAASAFVVFALAMGMLITGIDNAAHIGGLFAGALLSIVLSRRWTRRSPRSQVTRYGAGAVVVAGIVGLVVLTPAPRYRLGEELRAREAIAHFLDQDRRISQQWESLLGSGRKDTLTFDQLAGRIDNSVTAQYQESFEQLSALRLDAAAPSAQTLDILRKYAALRSDASQALSEGLRARDQQKIRKALETARQAPDLARGTPPGVTPAASAASNPATATGSNAPDTPSASR